MLTTKGMRTKIKAQERKIGNLEYAVKAMEERNDAVLYLLERNKWKLQDYDKTTVVSMLKPMHRSKTKYKYSLAMGLGLFFPGHQSKEIDREIEEEELTRINKLYEYLQGKLPKGVTCYAPKLSREQAISIIWFLQEITGCLPQKYEQCSVCEEIYNSESEGHYSELTKEHYCEYCLHAAPFTECEDCGEDVLKDEAYSGKHDAYLCDECKKEREELNAAEAKDD